jgi:hypothetical protein
MALYSPSAIGIAVADYGPMWDRCAVYPLAASQLNVSAVNVWVGAGKSERAGLYRLAAGGDGLTTGATLVHDFGIATNGTGADGFITLSAPITFAAGAFPVVVGRGDAEFGFAGVGEEIGYPNGDVIYASRNYNDYSGTEAFGAVIHPDSGDDASARIPYIQLVYTVGSAAPTGSLAATESPDTAAISAQVKVTGNVSATDAADSAQIFGGTGHFGSIAATESGADTAAISGFYNPTHKLQQFSILASFVQTGADSLGHALTGSPVNNDQALLPTEDGLGNLIAWEVDGGGHPSLRIASMAGSGNADNLPWRYFNGTTWISSVFNTRAGVISGAVGALTATESGNDSAAINANVGVRATAAATESGSDTGSIAGKVGVSGSLSATEAGNDYVVSGTGRFGSIAATEVGADTAHLVGTTSNFDIIDPEISISVAITELLHDFAATASDNVGVAGVQWFVNGLPIGAETTSAPWAFQWNKKGQLNGVYRFVAQARDAAGNRRTSNSIEVVVTDEAAPQRGAPYAGGGSTLFEQENSVWRRITER